MSLTNWREDRERRSGRTTMDALHIVQLSLDNPGLWIPIDDHHQRDVNGDRLLLDLVIRVFGALDVRFEKNGFSVRTMGPPQPYIYPNSEEAARAYRRLNF